jgi:DNA-binding NtrC family response regulator
VSVISGKRVLLVEDEAIIARMVEDMLSELGAFVVGPVSTVAKALAVAMAEAIDAAVLDVNVRGEMIDDVAALLEERGVPLVLATGYGAGAQPKRPGVEIIDKPYTRDRLERALAAAFAGKDDAAGQRMSQPPSAIDP